MHKHTTIIIHPRQYFILKSQRGSGVADDISHHLTPPEERKSIIVALQPHHTVSWCRWSKFNDLVRITDSRDHFTLIYIHRRWKLTGNRLAQTRIIQCSTALLCVRTLLYRPSSSAFATLSNTIMIIFHSQFTLPTDMLTNCYYVFRTWLWPSLQR